jgi:hypothetical protein
MHHLFSHVCAAQKPLHVMIGGGDQIYNDPVRVSPTARMRIRVGPRACRLNICSYMHHAVFDVLDSCGLQSVIHASGLVICLLLLLPQVWTMPALVAWTSLPDIGQRYAHPFTPEMLEQVRVRSAISYAGMCWDHGMVRKQDTTSYNEIIIIIIIIIISSLHFQLRPACGLHEYTSQAAARIK